jgi:hypothetical protein
MPGAPGSGVVQYLDDNDTPRAVTSTGVNDHVGEITGEDIAAKNFRTWAGTNLPALALRELEAFDTQTKPKRDVVQAAEAVAKMLGNTPAICRKCYIHPAIFNGYLDGSLSKTLQKRANAKLADPDAGLSAEELAVMAFLTRQLTGPNDKSSRGGLIKISRNQRLATRLRHVDPLWPQKLTSSQSAVARRWVRLCPGPCAGTDQEATDAPGLLRPG